MMIPSARTPETRPKRRVFVHSALARPFAIAFLWFTTTQFSSGQIYEKIFDFEKAREDDVLQSKYVFQLARDTDGNFYGASRFGGFLGLGSVFKMTPSGTITTLAEFEHDINMWPSAALVRGADGNFYGTSAALGRFPGAIFRLTPDGAFTNLVEFDWDNPINGYHPATTLVQGSDGSFYGMTRMGGAFDRGTIFKVNTSGTLTTLVHFNQTNGSLWSSADHESDVSLVVGDDGNFYGVTANGGLHGHGTFFRMTPGGDLTTLVNFTGNEETNKGSHPNSLILTSDGSFFGTTLEGGSSDGGTAFRVTNDGNLTTIEEFNSQEGVFLPNSLIQASDGNFYGTSLGGDGGNSDHGTVFRLTPGGSLSVLVQFTGSEEPRRGGYPESLVQGSDGHLYGTTLAYDLGDGVPSVIFRLSLSGNMTVLSELTNNEGTMVGWAPKASLVESPDGLLYGTTMYGGIDVADTSFSGKGSAFAISPSGAFSTIHRFTDGKQPTSLVSGGDGNFYGTTESGGALGWGTIFRMSPTGVFDPLIDFTDDGSIAKGRNPMDLTLGDDGNFYGTTLLGGENGRGTIFRMDPTGVFSTLVEFGDGESDHGLSHPGSSLVLGEDGNFYGTTSGPNFSGSIFKITPDGDLTKLIQLDNRVNELVLGPDGDFYGTTEFGGANDFGTILKVTPAGSVTTLVEFTGNGSTHRGERPKGALEVGADGNLYGTTWVGGAFGFGTVFKMSPEGVFSTIWEFESASDGYPEAGLLAASDGNLYGTTFGPGGIIYRIILPGEPMIGLTRASQRVNGGMHFETLINPRGARTQVSVEFGTDGENFPFMTTLSVNLTGFQHQLVGSEITWLPPGESYYYRIRASNSSGTSVSRVSTFSTIAEPSALIGPASEILPSSVRLNGTVNPRNYDATVSFEWGTDGNSFPNAVPASPSVVTGNTPVPVSAPIAGLTRGTTYYYRVVATNAGGTAVSGTQSFRTLAEPTASIGGSFALSTTSVRVEGSVDPEGSDTNVVFEYGTDGIDFPNSVAAAQGLQSGNGGRAVTAVLANLSQGVTYHYRIRANSDGGLGVSSSASFSMNVLSGFTRLAPGAPPESQGFLFVNLAPAGLAHGWRFLGEQQWRASGVPVGGLASGDRVIEFRPVSNHIAPPAESVSVTSGAAATVLERAYFATGTGVGGGLAVTLKPDSITSGPDRAQWRLLGEGDGDWRDSGAVLTGLAPGSHIVESKPVPGRATPASASVKVIEGQIASPTLTYFESGNFGGDEAAPLAFETVAQEPCAYVGQLRSSAGSGTGFVVKERVVATAAHVVWSEGTLTAATGLEWHFQRHAGIHEPRPQIPRGFYLLTGYDLQRRAENSPGSLSPQSRNRDVASLYFTEDAARGGFGGFLASDLEENEFLLSGANKILVGYPVNGVAASSRGRMHATSPFNIGFAPVPFTPGGVDEPGRIFLTTDIRSSGGASGGPLLVQFEGGAYYPAAIYLGGATQTIVRAIDSKVIELFDLSEESGIDGDPHTGGGITHTGVQPIGGPGDPGAIEVRIQPAAALNAGAKWRLRPETAFRNSGTQLGGLNAGRYVLELTAVPGFQVPPPQSLLVAGGQLRILTFSYALPPVAGPEIHVRGNGRDIADGDATPSALDGTDFGVVLLEGSTATRTFTVGNSGGRALSLGSPVLSSDHGDDFQLTTPPAASVPPGGSTTFSVTFDPSATGIRTAMVSFPNNDANENPFNFALQGNNETDSNANGFSDVEEAALNALLATFTVGQRVDLDLSFLRLGDGHTLALTGLPPGLVFNPATKRLTGTILGKPAPGHLLRKMDGATELGSRAFDLRVFFPARLVVSTAPRRFAPTLVNRRSAAQFVRLTNSGELPLQRLAVRLGGTAPNDFLLPVRPPATLNPGASATVSVVFRPLGRGTRTASLVITSSGAPRSVPLSGVGK